MGGFVLPIRRHDGIAVRYPSCSRPKVKGFGQVWGSPALIAEVPHGGSGGEELTVGRSPQTWLAQSLLVCPHVRLCWDCSQG